MCTLRISRAMEFCSVHSQGSWEKAGPSTFSWKWLSKRKACDEENLRRKKGVCLHKETAIAYGM